MRRPRRLLPWAAAAAALGGAAAVVAVAATRTGSAPEPAAAPIAATASLTPRVTLFGSVVSAEIRVVADERRVDPGTVRVAARFGPYTVVGKPERRVSGGVVRVDYRLQCLAAACSRPGGQAAVHLPPAVVTWGRTGRGRVSWPAAAVASRLAAADVARPRLRYATAAPEPSARGDGRALGWAAVAAAAALLAGVGVFALRFPAGRRDDEPELSEVERVLDRLAHARHQAERRSTVGQLAEALEHDGFPELAPLARRLAWSRTGPTTAVASELSMLVRAALETAP